MDWLTFIAEALKSLAWPATVIVLVLLLRQKVFEALKELKRLKWKDIEVEFDKQVIKTKAEAEKFIPKTIRPLRPGDQDDLESRLLSLAEVSTKAAVLDAWAEVEKEVARLLRRRDISPEQISRLSPLLMADHLRRFQILNDNEIWLFNSLRQLRNSAAHEHEKEITEEGALTYLSMATDFIRALKQK